MSETSENLQQTSLYDLHVELGGKMVGFAGYLMPVQYPAGIVTEHNHTRSKAGLFDVCLLYTSPSPRDQRGSRMPSSA